MEFPESLFQIEIPSWEAVIQPLKSFAIKQYQEKTGKTAEHLTDEIIDAFDELPVNNVADFEKMGIEIYKEQQSTHRYYYQIFPQILKKYTEQSEYSLDETELKSFTEDYFAELESHADKYDMTLSEYGEKIMNIDGDVEQEFNNRAKEDFVFKLIAQDNFASRGGEIDELAYESFIQKNVIHQQADPIELKEKIPYEVFVKLIPEMQLSQEIYDYFFPKIEFVINLDASLIHNQ